MSISVASCSLEQLFTGESINDTNGELINGVLAIPEYQRPYCWNETQISRLLEGYAEYLNEKVNAPKLPFYIGSVILHQSEQNARLNIIDGQQRLTTLALIAFVQGQHQNLSLCFVSPESQQQILHNLDWLQKNQRRFSKVEFSDINLTIVITRSEDDAYRFFETQNTGGVRLAGPDIIKAHHLRAIERDKQKPFAILWEDLGNLNPVVDALIRGRYWQNLKFREVPSHRQPQLVRASVVSELAELTQQGEDVGFGRIIRIYQSDGGQLNQHPQQGYELRQPLNAGVNTVHYLAYFEGLRRRYLTDKVSHLTEFNHFYKHLINRLDGCSYLKNLFDTSLLLYVSQYGEMQLATAAKKLFRVVYSPRVSNQTAVREQSIASFLKNTPVLDWITSSYTPMMCFDNLDKFQLKVDSSNLKPEDNSVKKRFVLAVCEFFSLEVDKRDLAEQFAPALDKKIIGNILGGKENVK